MPFTVSEVARRENVLLRAFFMGPTGSGKSRAALEVASRLAHTLEIPDVVLINTELGRGKLYADRFRYRLIDLAETAEGADADFSPDEYVAAIDYAEEHWPQAVYVIDSVSHEWMGKEGILQQADRFGDWKTVRPKHNAWVERLLQMRGHLIVTCRAKMKYEVSEEPRPGGNGTRQVINMLGVGPIQSDDLQYEFNFVGRFEQATHIATFSGHVDPLDGVATEVVGPAADKVVATVVEWLSEGEPPAVPEAAPDEKVAELIASLQAEKFDEKKIEAGFARARREGGGVLTVDYVDRNIAASKERLAKKDDDKPAADPAPAPAAVPADTLPEAAAR